MSKWEPVPIRKGTTASGHPRRDVVDYLEVKVDLKQHPDALSEDIIR